MNPKKRNALADPADKPRPLKKLKDGNGITHSATDNKKKRKKRRRKISVVAATESESHTKPRTEQESPVGEQSPETSTALPQFNAPTPNDKSDKALDMSDVEDAVSSSSYTGKRKGNAKEESQEDVKSHKAEIVRLKQELESQSQLLQKHQTHFVQVQQSLTCQICLDLLYKPYSLAPCGHVACLSCLVNWFTTSDAPGSPQHRQTSHIHKKKKCPICRTTIAARPAEIWAIKNMVANLVRSGLADLPAPIPEELAPGGPSNATSDPWRNIFPLDHAFPSDGAHILDYFGVHDEADGVYRCIACNFELWRGVCPNCDREYPGHMGGVGFDDGLDGMGQDRLNRLLDIVIGVEQSDDSENIDSDGDGNSILMTDSEDEDDSEDLIPIVRRIQNQIRQEHTHDRPAWESSSVEEGIARIEDENGDEDAHGSENEGDDGYESSFIDDDDDDAGSSLSPTGTRSVSIQSDTGLASSQNSAQHAGRTFRAPPQSSPRRIFRRSVNVESDDIIELAPTVTTIIGNGRTRTSHAGPDEYTLFGPEDDFSDSSSENSRSLEGSSENGNEGEYEEDGSRVGPSSRLLRLMLENDDE